MADTISLYTSLDRSVRNKRQDRILSTPTALSKKGTAPDPGVGRKITLSDGSETVQVLSDAKIEQERKLRGRLPHGFGTAKYNELMARHRALKRSQEQERNARFEARAERRELSDTQESFIERELARVEGHPVDCAGRLLEPEPV